MIHDAVVQVTCDRENTPCWEVQHIPLTALAGGSYGDHDSTIEKRLVQRGWIVEDGKHYCCEEHSL
jgi:hypothetical protein